MCDYQQLIMFLMLIRLTVQIKDCLTEFLPEDQLPCGGLRSPSA